MFADFKAGRVRHYVRIEIMDGITLDVGIVAIQRGGELGFVTTDGRLGSSFYVEQKGFRIQRFNERNLFVLMSDTLSGNFMRLV